jgi:hypothetical protein
MRVPGVSGYVRVDHGVLQSGLGRVKKWTLKNIFNKVFNLTLLTQKWLVKALIFMLKPLLTPLITFSIEGL